MICILMSLQMRFIKQLIRLTQVEIEIINGNYILFYTVLLKTKGGLL